VAEGLSLMARLAYDDFEGRAGRALPEPPVSVGLFQDKGYDRWGTAELRADWRPHAVLRIDLGSSVKHHAVRHQAFSSAVPALAADLVNGFSEVNSWTSVEIKAGRGLVLHGGLTVFHHSLFGTQLTPKLAAVWQPTPEDTAKAIWSMGFRPPTFVEARFTDNLAYLKNPDLKPEMVSSAELAYEHRFGGVASAGASFFWNAYRDLIRYETVVAPGLDHAPNPSNPSDFRQIPRNAPRSLGVLGADLSATLRFGRWAQAYGGVSLQRADETARPNFPGLTGNLTFSSRALWEPLLLSVRATALSARTKAPESVLPGQRAAVPAAVSLGAFAALEVPGVRNLQLELAVFNLLDGANPGPAPANLSPTEELPEAARTIRADLRWRF
jgi:outer membrane receptor protein involved in Fe transport